MSRRQVLLIVFTVALLLVGVGLYVHFHEGGERVVPSQSVNPKSDPSGGPSKRGVGMYPNPRLTPGAIDQAETKEKVCTPNHTKTTRHVTEAMKREVFERYGLAYNEREEDAWEVDHFIPLVLGGANSVENLWPEPALPRPGFHEKDVVEVYLHRQVCSGAMTLGEAQEAIRKDWYAVYQEWSVSHKHKHPRAKERDEERVK